MKCLNFIFLFHLIGLSICLDEYMKTLLKQIVPKINLYHGEKFDQIETLNVDDYDPFFNDQYFNKSWTTQIFFNGFDMLKPTFKDSMIDGFLEYKSKEDSEGINLIEIQWNEQALYGLDIPDLEEIEIIEGKSIEIEDNRYHFDLPNLMKAIGHCVGALLLEFHQLEKIDLQTENVNLTGFCVGAHAAGFTGKYLKEYGYDLKLITALDPAALEFWGADIENRLDGSDAHQVVVFHSSDKLGIYDAIGTLDIYLNGGRTQPHCPNDLTGDCSHTFAHQYYAYFITAGSLPARVDGMDHMIWIRGPPPYKIIHKGGAEIELDYEKLFMDTDLPKPLEYIGKFRPSEDIKFNLFNKDNRIISKPITDSKPYHNEKTIVFIDGFQDTELLKNDLLKVYLGVGLDEKFPVKNVNLIEVDWAAGKKELCLDAFQSIFATVGHYVAKFLTGNWKCSFDAEDLVVVGHHWGAHIAGWTGKYLHYPMYPKRPAGILLSQIVALDPGYYPGFENEPVNRKLQLFDAKDVIVFHSKMDNKLAIGDRLGSLDVYLDHDGDEYEALRFSSYNYSMICLLHDPLTGYELDSLTDLSNEGVERKVFGSAGIPKSTKDENRILIRIPINSDKNNLRKLIKIQNTGDTEMQQTSEQSTSAPHQKFNTSMRFGTGGKSNPEFILYTVDESSIIKEKEGAKLRNAESDPNVLLIIVPRGAITRMMEDASLGQQFSNFARRLKQNSNGIDVKILSVNTKKLTYMQYETKISGFLIEYGGPDSSSKVTIFSYDGFSKNQYGYPTYTDGIGTPFETYKNSALTMFFNNILNGRKSILEEYDAEHVSPPKKSVRVAPWNHGVVPMPGQTAVYVYNLKDEIREKREGDCILVDSLSPYQPADNSAKYKFSTSDDHFDKNFVFIILPRNTFNRLISKPKNGTVKPKRWFLFKYAHRWLYNIDVKFDVKLLVWPNLKTKLSDTKRAQLMNEFLTTHKPNDMEHIEDYSYIFGFGPFDLRYEFVRANGERYYYCPWNDRKLKEFFQNIAVERYDGLTETSEETKNTKLTERSKFTDPTVRKHDRSASSSPATSPRDIKKLKKSEE